MIEFVIHECKTHCGCVDTRSSLRYSHPMLHQLQRPMMQSSAFSGALDVCNPLPTQPFRLACEDRRIGDLMSGLRRQANELASSHPTACGPLKRNHLPETNGTFGHVRCISLRGKSRTRMRMSRGRVNFHHALRPTRSVWHERKIVLDNPLIHASWSSKTSKQLLFEAPPVPIQGQHFAVCRSHCLRMRRRAPNLTSTTVTMSLEVTDATAW